MSSPENENGMIVHDFPPLIRVYKDGRVERFLGTETVPAGSDPQTGVESKDVSISDNVSARIYLPLPKVINQKKLPLLVYFHGGGFCIESASSPTYHNHLNLLASEAGLVAVSVDYRRAPEHPLPAAFDDSWAALQWVQSHAAVLAADAPPSVEPWLTDHADFSRVFLAGDSAGATIAHHMGIRAGVEGLAGIRLGGVVLVHPFFGGEESVGKEVISAVAGMWRMDSFWKVVCPGSCLGLDDPWINPATDPNLKLMGSERVLILVAEKDFLRDRGLLYKEVLAKSDWQGEAELVETKGEGHVFHLLSPSSDNALAFINKLVLFINQRERTQPI